MAEFTRERKFWLKKYIDLGDSTPSHDTFNRVFQLIDPQCLQEGLNEDGKKLLNHLKERLIAIDGKKLKGVSPKSKGNSGLYILNAWVCDQGLCIGQTKVMDKSNEITAIPILLDELELQGTTVSIDAIGCQKEVAEQIISAEADYILAVKGNQKDLLEEVQEGFDHCACESEDSQWEYDHGRFETRKCEVINGKAWLSPDLKEKWSSIEQLVKITASREIGEVTTTNTRYYITSHANKTAAQLNKMIRSHWSIENQLHWHLDVTFDEDSSRARMGNAPLNLSTMRKMALHRIKKDNAKLSQKKRRFRASMNTDYLDQLLNL